MKLHLLARLVLMFSLLSGHAYAEADHPTRGQVFSTKEASSFWYECELKHSHELECQFIYTSVRKKANWEDWGEELAMAEKNWPGIKKDMVAWWSSKPLDTSHDQADQNASQPTAKELEESEKIVKYLEERGFEIVVEPELGPTFEQRLQDKNKICKVAEVAIKIYGVNPNLNDLDEDSRMQLEGLPDGEKEDIRNYFLAVKNLCQNFSKEALIELGRLDFDKKTRTCRVYTSYYRKTFELQPSRNWVSVQEIPGICHSVVVQRFELKTQENPFLESAGLHVWNLYRRETATDPSRMFFDSTCRENIDETEHEFSWMDRDLYMGCDYIEFDY